MLFRDRGGGGVGAPDDYAALGVTIQAPREARLKLGGTISMEKVSFLVRNLVLIVAVTAFLELLLPVGEMRRYVRMVMGVLIIVAVLQVLVGFFNRMDGFSVPEVAVEPPRGAGPDYEEIRAAYTGRALAAYRDGMARQVEALARITGLSVTRVEVLLDEKNGEYPQLKEVKLHLEQGVPVAAGDAARTENAVKTIADFYNLPRERVVVATP